MKNLSKKIVYLILLAIILTLATCYSVRHVKAPLPAAHDFITVTAAKVKSAQIPIQAEAIGTLVSAQSVKMTSEVSGQVAKILFQDGSFIKEGVPLIQLDDTVAKAKVEANKAQLLYSEVNYKRMTTLSKQGAVTKQAVDQALADYVEKKALVAEGEVALQKMTLIAPFAGKVGQSKVHLRDYVTVGEELVTLTDTHHLRVEYSLSEKYLPVLKLGQTVSVTTSTYPNKVFTGKVTYISPTINIEDRTISLYATIPNDDDSLTAGLYVNVTQGLGVVGNALLIPTSSLMPTLDGQQVYKIVANKAIATTITIGDHIADDVQVFQGLTINDSVVVSGLNKLKDGSYVRVQS